MFWQNYTRLCDEIGKSPNRVAAECGFSNAVATGWKRGALPQDKTLLKLADYFGVTVAELTEDKGKIPQEDAMLLTFFHSFNREGRGKLLDYAESMQRSGKFDPNIDYFLQGLEADD